MNIYNNVKEIAAQKKISITDLEKAAGLANGTIGKWKDSVPKVSSLEAVAKALKVTVSQLIKE